MCEEGAAKLRLKSRTAPSARGRERSPEPEPEPPPRPQTSADRCSWFEKEELNECEKTWILLLKDTGQDSQCTNWDTVPSFPEFLEKKAEEKSPEHQEVFTVGMKDFQWVSFPSFYKEKCLNPEDLSSQQPTQSQSNELHKGQADKLKSLSSTAEKTCWGTSTDQAKTAAGEETRGVSNLGVSPKSCKLRGHSISAQPSALAQSPAADSSPQQHRTGTVQNSRTDREGKGEKEPQIQTHQRDVPAGEAGGMPVEKPPLGSAPGTESQEEKVENQSEGASALESCPMCLMQFSGRLSQLDIDGHLARCLSESPDDFVW